MQTIRIKAPSSDTARGPSDPPIRHEDALPLLAGTAVAVAAVGAMLALTDIASPLRAPFTLFFLLAAPGAAIAAALRGLEPWGRILASVSGAVAVNLLVAQAMLALHIWSVRGGVAAITVIGSLIYLLVLVRRLRRRTPTRRTS
ncbi:hypothetical protein AB0Q95_21875 [Streptomyces sp. NPDC059900]|uniref:hypothetical protein n=1 Tax=Streptomyces sp. NPDC059900 TaxID=3155816 RepID=UPI003420C7EA